MAGFSRGLVSSTFEGENRRTGSVRETADVKNLVSFCVRKIALSKSVTPAIIEVQANATQPLENGAPPDWW